MEDALACSRVVAHNVGQTTFLLPRRKYCIFKICCLGTQTRKHLGNIQSQCFFGVSQVIPRLLPHATYVEDTEFVSWKQNMLLKFSATMFTRLCRPLDFSRFNTHLIKLNIGKKP